MSLANRSVQVIVGRGREGFHAEVNGINTAGEMGFTPIGGVLMNPICDGCVDQIGGVAAECGYELQLGNCGNTFTLAKTGAP